MITLKCTENNAQSQVQAIGLQKFFYTVFDTNCKPIIIVIVML